MTDWTTATAADLGRAYDAGQADPREVTEAYLKKINGHPLRDRIYARLTPARALSEAAAASARAFRGERLSALDGVPISWKDLFDTAGVETEAGSALLKGRTPDADAKVLATATSLGLVCLGKTHMSELAFSGLGLNPITASPPCVNDADAVSGGSSSGAAASVAFGLAAAAVGSDTGGSVRIPAAWNDLVGLKTTSGRISLDGVVPLAARFDTVGPLCKTVEDAALMLGALEGRKAQDLRNPTPVTDRRFAALRTIVMDDVRDAPAAAYADSLKRLEAAGARIEWIDAPEIEGPMGDAGVLYTAEAWGIWRDEITARPDLMFAPIRERFEGGKGYSGADYVAAWRRVDAARKLWHARALGFDAVLCPTAPNLPPKLHKLMEQGEYYVTENLLTLRNTRVGNLMGLSAITLPTSTPSCGVSIMGLANGEEALLRIAASVERVLR